MKVLDAARVQQEGQVAASQQRRPEESTGSYSFRQQITDMSRTQYEEYLSGLKERIFEQGEVIKKKADVSEFRQYRKLISEFIGEVAGNAYSCTRSSKFDINGRHKVFVVIKKIDSRLDEMAQEILSGQSDNLKLMNMVDDIRGLLVDMFL